MKNKKEKIKIVLIAIGLFFISDFFFTRIVLASDFKEEKMKRLSHLSKEIGSGFESSIDQLTGKLESLSKGRRKLPLWEGKKNNTLGNSKDFLNKFGKYFDLEDPEKDLEFLRETKDNLGISHLRYAQRFNGIPVLGGRLIVHIKDTRKVTAVSSKIHSPQDQVETNPKINKEDSIESAKKFWREKFGSASQIIGEPSLYIYNKNFVNSKDEDYKNYLVWKVDLFSLKPHLHKIFYINSQDGALVAEQEQIKTAVDRRVYNCNSWSLYNDCVLTDTINNVDHGRSEGVAERGITDIDNLYDYTGSAHNYYVDNFTRQGANNQGGLGDDFANPYEKTDSFGRTDSDPYRGEYCPNNAYFEVNASYGGATINFCDNAAVKDIVGHEYGHGMSYFSILDSFGNPSGLYYYYESGALEEANADIFGEALENYIDGSSDWLIGEDITGTPFRDMSDPDSRSDGIGPYPDRFYSTNFYCGDSDNGGVHHNSTVITHAAYLMAVGGTFNGCTITGIGRTKEEAIFYRAINEYLTEISDFNDAYTALNTACEDLYTAGSEDCNNVKKALRAVEIDQGGECSIIPATTPQCDFDSDPTISSVSSSVANGSYAAGSTIDIDVYFSEQVTSTGNVTVNLNTGRSCTFAVSGSSTGSCNYTVNSADNVSSLNVTSISGIITDVDGNAMSNFSPATNLSQNKSITIDNIAPVISGVANSQTYSTDISPTFNEGTATLNGSSFSSGQTISQNGSYQLIVTDSAGNSTAVNFTVEKSSTSPTVNAPADTTSPTIYSVENNQIYRTDISPTFNEGTATLNGNNFSSGQTVTQDGTYQLVVTDNAGNTTTVNFTIEKISSSVSSLPYATKKAKKRINFSVYGLNLPNKLKKKNFSARLNGRKIKLSAVKNKGQYIVVYTKQNYRKWPRGSYNFSLSYNFKYKKVRYQNSVLKNNVLSIQ